MGLNYKDIVYYSEYNLFISVTGRAAAKIKKAFMRLQDTSQFKLIKRNHESFYNISIIRLIRN